MGKGKDIKLENDVMVVEMAASPSIAVTKINVSGGYIQWGENNKTPSFLINILNNHPEHGAIVKGKARYLSGLKLIPSLESPIVDQFLKNANRYEDWYSLKQKVDGDYSLYGGWAVQINPNPLGQPVACYHIDMGKLRPSTCRTGLWYSDNWEETVENKLQKVFFPFFTPGLKEPSIYYYKDHVPSVNHLDGVLPIPDYFSVLTDIETDIEISLFFNFLVDNGFSAGHIITFFNGKFTDEKKREIESRFKDKHTGTKNAGKVVLVFTNPDGKGTQVENITPTGLAEQYEALNKRNENKIVRGHNVPRALFKMESEGSLGDRTVLDLQHELFINEFAKPRQTPFNSFLKKILFLAKNIDCDFEVEQIKLIGKQFPIDNALAVAALNARDPNIYTNLLIKEFNIDVPVADISQTPPAQIQEGNDRLAKLTGRQRGALDTIARKFNSQKITEQQAIMQLMPFGFTESDAKLYLGIEANQLKVQQSNHISWLQLNTVEINEDYELIDERPYDFKLKDDDYKKENGNIVPKKGFLQELKGFIDTFRKKDDANKYNYEVVTLYKYALRPELKAKGEPILLANSHQFCIDQVKATEGNKRISFEEADDLVNDFGENGWDKRGGYWGKKDTCRHIWWAETFKRKVVK